MAETKNKPASKVKAAVKTADSTGDQVLAEDPGQAVTGDATQPDEVSESARLGGQTVEKLKAEPEDQKPAASLSRSDKGGEMTLTPNHEKLLVGNSYTAEVSLPKGFNEEAGDVATFIHPAGWDVKAAVVGNVASGTFLIERERAFNFGFKVNGKKIASASYETRDA